VEIPATLVAPVNRNDDYKMQTATEMYYYAISVFPVITAHLLTLGQKVNNSITSTKARKIPMNCF
jgi:hypothetical protein